MCYTIRVSDRTILSPIVCVCYRRSSSFVCCCSFFASWFPYIPQYCPTFYVLLFFCPYVFTFTLRSNYPNVSMGSKFSVTTFTSMTTIHSPLPHSALRNIPLSHTLSAFFNPALPHLIHFYPPRNNFYGLTWHSKVTYSSSPTCPSSFESKRRGWNVLFFFSLNSWRESTVPIQDYMFVYIIIINPQVYV